MGFFSDFFKAIFAPFNLALKQVKENVDTKNVPGILASTSNVIKGLAVAAEKTAEEVEKQGAKIIGPEKKEIVKAQAEEIIVKPIEKEAEEERDTTKSMFLGILASIIRIAIPILIDKGVSELNSNGWKFN